MAVTKLWAVKYNLSYVLDYAGNHVKTKNPNYTEEQYQALSDVIAYAKDEEKTESADDKEYVTFEADSMDELLSRVRAYTYDNASSRVMTDSEKMLGTQVDYKG